MIEPKRKPDFSWRVHDFWCYPEMIMWDGVRKGYDELVDIDGELYYIWGTQREPDTLREEIQKAYLQYKVEEILLGSETESKLD